MTASSKLRNNYHTIGVELSLPFGI